MNNNILYDNLDSGFGFIKTTIKNDKKTIDEVDVKIINNCKVGDVNFKYFDGNILEVAKKVNENGEEFISFNIIKNKNK